jgi:hypothetical protein
MEGWLVRRGWCGMAWDGMGGRWDVLCVRHGERRCDLKRWSGSRAANPSSPLLLDQVTSSPSLPLHHPARAPYRP